MARRRAADFSRELIDRELADTWDLIEVSTRIVAQVRLEETTAWELLRRSRSAISDKRRRFGLQAIELTAMARESRYEMTVRHIAEQKRRVAKQKALIARLSDRGLSTVQAKELLAEMINMLDDMRTELDRLANP